MTIWRPSNFGWLSTFAISLVSSIILFINSFPKLVCCISRPLNLTGGYGVNSSGNTTFNQGYTGANSALNDRTFADQMFEVLDLNFLELKHLRVFISKIKEYREKYGVHPTSNIMLSIIRTGLEGEAESVKTRIRDYYARVLANGELPEGSDFIKDTSLDFCKKQKLKETQVLLRILMSNKHFCARREHKVFI